MNDISFNDLLQKQIKGKFKGRTKLRCRVALHYKENAEREYARLLFSYVRIAKEVLKLYFPEIKAAYFAEVGGVVQYREDDKRSLIQKIEDAFNKMGIELYDKISRFQLEKKIDSMATQAGKLSVKEWKKVVNSTLGIDIMDDYYLGEFFRQQMSVWTNDNVNLIKSLPNDTLTDMREIMKQGFLSGKTLTDIVAEIEHTYHVSRSKAKFLARDQMAKLNSDLAQAQQRDAGITQYEWSSSQDGRVRDTHRELNGKRFRWDEPPVVDKKTGRRAHPGQDYQCRCVALPVFDIDTLNLPFDGKRK